METVKYLGSPRRVIEKVSVGLRPSIFDPDNIHPVDLFIVESRPGWFIVLSVPHDGGNVRQVGDEQPTLEEARAFVIQPGGDR